jgi:hypothetical protein
MPRTGSSGIARYSSLIFPAIEHGQAKTIHLFYKFECIHPTKESRVSTHQRLSRPLRNDLTWSHSCHDPPSSTTKSTPFLLCSMHRRPLSQTAFSAPVVIQTEPPMLVSRQQAHADSRSPSLAIRKARLRRAPLGRQEQQLFFDSRPQNGQQLALVVELLG